MSDNPQVMIPSTTRLLKVPDVAEQLSMHRSQIYRLIDQGKLPTVRIGSMIRIRSADLERFIDERTEGGSDG